MTLLNYNATESQLSDLNRTLTRSEHLKCQLIQNYLENEISKCIQGAQVEIFSNRVKMCSVQDLLALDANTLPTKLFWKSLADTIHADNL